MKLSSYLIYMALLALGCVLGAFFCNFSYFQFDSKINIFELTSLIFTTGLGVYVAANIGRALSLRSSEKSILLDEVKESIKLLEKINDSIERRSYSVKTIASTLKSLNEHLYLLENLFQFSHCSTLDLTDVRNDLRSLRSVVTGFPATNNIITLDITSYKSSKSAYRMLKHRYFVLMLRINQK